MRNCLHLIYANMLEKSWKIFGVGQFLLNGKNLSTDLYILQHNYTWYIKDCQQWITWGKARILLPSYNPWKINCSISNMIDIYLQVHKSLWRLEGRKPDMLTSHTTWPQKKKFSLTPQSQVSCLHKLWSRIMMMILYNKLDMYSIRERGRERDREMGYLFRSSFCMHNIINYFLLCVCRFIALKATKICEIFA